MVDKLDQVAAHCQLMVKLSSLHFKANWLGGLIINLLGLLSEGNIVGTLGVKGGGTVTSKASLSAAIRNQY